jgi:hypothetical protein
MLLSPGIDRDETTMLGFHHRRDWDCLDSPRKDASVMLMLMRAVGDRSCSRKMESGLVEGQQR